MADAVTCIMGIDPGKSGALAFYFPEHNRVAVEDMPIVGDRLEPHALLAHIEQFRPTHAVVELVGTRPKQGIRSAFNFGEGCGVIRGIVAAARVPVVYVTPAVWKRHFRLSQDKNESRRRALELFPTASKHFARVKDDGRAEAALIARWFAETSPLFRTGVAA